MSPESAGNIRILILEDQPTDAELVEAELRRSGLHFVTRIVDSRDAFGQELDRFTPDLILSDFTLPAFDGLEALDLARSRLPHVPFLFVSGTIGEERAVEAMKRGATDYVLKDRMARLGPAVLQILEQSRLRAEKEKAEGALREAEAKFRQIAENISGVFWLIDFPKREVLYISPGYERIWGRSCERLHVFPRDWIEDVHPGDRPRLMRAFGKQLSGDYAEEYRIVRPDGSVRWIFDRAFPVPEKDGVTSRIAGIAEDITERKQAETALQNSESRFRSFMSYLPGRASMRNPAGRYTFVNECWLRTFQLAEAAVIGRTPEEIFSADRAQAMEHAQAAMLKKKEPVSRVYSLDAGGAPQWWLSTRFPIADTSGKTVMSGTIALDITAQKIHEQRIEKLSRVRAITSQINSAIIRIRDKPQLFEEACRIVVEAGEFPFAWIGIVERTENVVKPVAWAGAEDGFLAAIAPRLTLDESASEGHGSSARAVLEKRAIVVNDIQNDPSSSHKSEHRERNIGSLAALPLLVADEPIGTLTLHARESGFFVEDEVKLLSELAGDIAFAVQIIEKQEKLDYLSYYDALTGLANRSLFLERVGQYMRSAGAGVKLAVGMIDLERFRNINDGLGRPAGDALLTQVAQWLTRELGDASLVARIGADHFAVVLPEVKPAGDVARLVEKLVEAFMEHPFHLNDAVFRFAAKVGVAVFPDDGAEADILSRNAEAALKKAKSGSDRYLFYTHEMTKMVAGKLTLENQLRHALESGEFVLHYQPKVHLLTGKLVGAEALIRWNDPRSGLVAPGRFIPILEETGLIYEVGRWALKQAIGDYLDWQARGLGAVRVAVNVSPLQLRHRGFISDIERATGIHAHAAGGLELEITESLIMEDVQNSISSLQSIRAMGVTIAIDDFGTGFSSLSYLAKLPVDTLKIDRSFVNDMIAGPDGLMLVSTIINLAHSLKLKVVAEGVETEDQARLLRLLKCDEMQGFLFSKPLPAAIFETSYL
jgi:diguanylate cyclase (GGDEF)-like protein/PAS domain S-box-containing protein